MFVLIAVIFIFSIFCLHSFSGDAFHRCRTTPEPITVGGTKVWPIIDQDKYGDDIICRPGSDEEHQRCPNGTYCGSPLDVGISLEDDGVLESELLQYGMGTGFRNWYDSFFAVLQHFTIDNWTVVLYNLIHASGETTWIICIIMVIFGNFFIMNLILAVIIQSFDDIIQHNKDNMDDYLPEEDEDAEGAVSR